MIISRVWAMPSADTFDVPPIAEFVARHLTGAVIVDPFARNSRVGTHRNDLNPHTDAESHEDARTFLRGLVAGGVKADCVVFDPPYSPRQISECYTEAGLKPTMQDTQSAAFKRECRNLIRSMVGIGGVVLSFGWNTVGMGPDFTTTEILLVCHGGDHNDTICMAQRRTNEQVDLWRELSGKQSEYVAMFYRGGSPKEAT